MDKRDILIKILITIFAIESFCVFLQNSNNHNKLKEQLRYIQQGITSCNQFTGQEAEHCFGDLEYWKKNF